MGEQTLFRRLGVFVGGWTLEAAEVVASELRIENEEMRKGSHELSVLNSQSFDGVYPEQSRRAQDRFSILNSIESLIAQSLLQQVAGPEGEPRFAMLETIREYALERLENSDESIALRRRHAAYYLALAEAAEPKVQDATQVMVLDRLEREHDNLRAALDWTLAGGDLEIGTKLACALWTFWWMRGYGSEGRMWLEEALRQSDNVAPAIRAKIFLVGGSVSVRKDDLHSAALGAQALALFRDLGDTAGMAKALAHMADMVWQQGDYAQAMALATESLALSRELSDQHGIAFALHKLGDIARDQGDYERASALLEESLATWQALRHDESCAFVLNGLGDVALNQGDYTLAAARYEEALALFHEMGGHDAIAWILRNLGRVAHIQGDHDRAAALLGESVAWFRKVRDRQGLAWALHHLGMATHAQGNYTRATALLREALTLQQQLNHKSQIVESLEAFAQLASAHGQATRATQLLGAANTLRTAIGAPRPPGERAFYERIVAGVRAQLGEAAFAAAWATGQTTSLEQAAAFALAT